MIEKIKESLFSVLPITVLVIILAFTIAQIDLGTIIVFSIGALMLILGMSLFTYGADVAMMPMGKSIGSFLSGKKKKMLFFVLFVCFVIGFVITIAEPDLHVLAGQLSITDNINYTLLLSVAAGVGAFLAVSIIRTIFKIKLRHILIACYLLLFMLAIFFVPEEFISVAFDSGGVTTGPITVPFLMAFGMGVASLKQPGKAKDNNFGTIALCSVGPILAVLILGMSGFIKTGYTHVDHIDINSGRQIIILFGNGLVKTMLEVAIAMGAIIVVFIIFQVFALKFPKEELIKMMIGFVITYIGLTVFLTGVNVGFMPMGKLMGSEIALKSYNYILIPLGMVMGCFIVLAEPAIQILNRQVEEITNGAISRKVMLTCLCLGVALAVGFAMIRVLTGISIWWFLLPAYGIALILMFFAPPMITGIAFDSGGVASGPMTATFLLPFAMGACTALGGNVMADAFGLVAFVAMMPILTIQFLGYAYRVRIKKLRAKRKRLRR